MLIELHRYRGGTRASSSSSCKDDPHNRALQDPRCRRVRGPRRARAGNRHLPRAAASATPRGRRCAPVDRPCAEDARADAEAIESYRARPRLPAGFRRCVLEPRQPQDLPLHGRGARAACARRWRRPRTALVDRYHLCFALGKALEDRGELRRILPLLRARQRAQAAPRCRYRPEIIERNTRQQIKVCTAEFFASARRAGVPTAGSHLHRRAAALGLDAARADPRLALAGRGHPGAADVQQIVSHLRGRDTDPDDPRYPRILASSTARRFPAARRGVPRRHARLPQRASPSSSTRCRTTSGTSG